MNALVKEHMVHPTDEPKRALVLKFDETPERRGRVALFFKIWGRNIRSRKISLVTAMIVIPSATIFTLSDLLYAQGVERAQVEAVDVPKFLQMLGGSPAAAEFLKIVLHTKYRGAPITSIVMNNTAHAIAAAATLQVTLALLQTVLELAAHNHQGEQKRETLVKLARSLDVSGTSTMNADQLRISIADALVSKMDSTV